MEIQTEPRKWLVLFLFVFRSLSIPGDYTERSLQFSWQQLWKWLALAFTQLRFQQPPCWLWPKAGLELVVSWCFHYNTKVAHTHISVQQNVLSWADSKYCRSSVSFLVFLRTIKQTFWKITNHTNFYIVISSQQIS